MSRRKLRVAITVEVTIDADQQTVNHVAATGEITDAAKLSVERAETKIQELLDKYGKRFNAVAGADSGSLYVKQETT